MINISSRLLKMSMDLASRLSSEMFLLIFFWSARNPTSARYRYSLWIPSSIIPPSLPLIWVWVKLGHPQLNVGPMGLKYSPIPQMADMADIRNFLDRKDTPQNYSKYSLLIVGIIVIHPSSIISGKRTRNFVMVLMVWFPMCELCPWIKKPYQIKIKPNQE